MVKIFSKLAVLSALSLLVANCANQNPVSFKDSGTQEVANVSFTPQGKIATRLASDGRVWLMARSTDNQTWYRSKPSNGSWTNWTAMTGAVSGNIAMIDNAGYIFGTSTSGILALSTDENHNMICATTNSSTATFSNWGETGTVDKPSGDIVAINDYNATLLFYTTPDNLMVQVWGQTCIGRMNIGYEKVGPKVAVGKNQDGHLEVFATNSANQLVHSWQTNHPTMPYDSKWYMAMDNLGGNINPGSDIAVGTNADGRLEVFVTWADHTMYHIWQVVPNGGWSNWAQMSPVAYVNNTISVGKNSSGTLETIYRINDLSSRTMHQFQLAPGGTTGWSNATTFFNNGPVTGIPDGANIAVTNFANGALAAFVFGRYSSDPYNIYYTYQDYTTLPDGWSRWAPLN